MENFNFPNKSDTAAGAGADMAGQIGTSALHIADAARDAGQRLGAVGKEEMSSLKVAAKGLASDASRRINQQVGVTTDYVKERPLQSVAVAAGIGMLLGMLITRR